MHQPSFSDVGYGFRKRTTKREEFCELWMISFPETNGLPTWSPTIQVVGVDAGSGYVHSLETIAANTRDITMGARLIREDDEVVLWRCGVPWN